MKMELGLKPVVPTQEDVIRAASVGYGDRYYSDFIIRLPFGEITEQERDYRTLLEVVFARERQLEHAISLLSEKNRLKVGV